MRWMNSRVYWCNWAWLTQFRSVFSVSNDNHGTANVTRLSNTLTTFSNLCVCIVTVRYCWLLVLLLLRIFSIFSDICTLFGLDRVWQRIVSICFVIHIWIFFSCVFVCVCVYYLAQRYSKNKEETKTVYCFCHWESTIQSIFIYTWIVVRNSKLLSQNIYSHLSASGWTFYINIEKRSSKKSSNNFNRFSYMLDS